MVEMGKRTMARARAVLTRMQMHACASLSLSFLLSASNSILPLHFAYLYNNIVYIYSTGAHVRETHATTIQFQLQPCGHGVYVCFGFFSFAIRTPHMSLSVERLEPSMHA